MDLYLNPEQDSRKQKQENTSNNSLTRTEKVKAHSKNTEANKQGKKSIRTDMQKHLEELATTEDEAAREGNMKQLHDITEKLAGEASRPETGQTQRMKDNH
ncbi:unnamed protein product [Schistosoma margrebowiei]|uniref:Uncharacterized protein n=1 Tax=Schistosoma margrebowiei TaxID=48269 RepID=A0A183L8L2_9TREM|nr:unnamed protein product [Schistosoma margrebowiei]